MTLAIWAVVVSMLVGVVSLLAAAVRALDAVTKEAREMGRQTAVTEQTLVGISARLTAQNSRIENLQRDVKQVQNWLHKNTPFTIREDGSSGEQR